MRIYFRILNYFFFLMLFLLSFWLQTHRFLNWDVSWHLLGARRMLHGAGYMTGVFDDNPPMVFWFYMPVILWNQYFSVSIIATQICYVELVTLCSFMLSSIFLKQLYALEEQWKLRLIQYAILIILLFLPGPQFGQREILITGFCLPYVILMTAKMQTPTKHYSVIILFLIGVWAAIGIAMNPLYGLIVIALEAQLYFKAKKLTLFRAEIITFFIASLLYILLIYMLYPDYFFDIIPAILVFSPGFNAAWYDLIFNYSVLFFVMTTLIFIALSIINKSSHLLSTFWLASIVSFAIYLSNMKIWYYHLFPAIAFSILLLTYIFCLKISSNSKDKMINFLIRAISFIGIFYIIMILFFGNFYKIYHKENSLFRDFIYFFDHQPHQNQSIYFLSTGFTPVFPLIDYTTIHYLPNHPTCWTIPIIVKNLYLNNAKGSRLEMITRYQHKFIAETIFALRYQHPDYFIIDASKDDPYLHHLQFSYIDFLSQNVTFRQLWKNYFLVKKVGDYDIYKRGK